MLIMRRACCKTRQVQVRRLLWEQGATHEQHTLCGSGIQTCARARHVLNATGLDLTRCIDISSTQRPSMVINRNIKVEMSFWGQGLGTRFPPLYSSFSLFLAGFIISLHEKANRACRRAARGRRQEQLTCRPGVPSRSTRSHLKCMDQM